MTPQPGFQTQRAAGIMRSPASYRRRLQLIACTVPYSEQWWRGGANNAIIIPQTLAPGAQP